MCDFNKFNIFSLIFLTLNLHATAPATPNATPTPPADPISTTPAKATTSAQAKNIPGELSKKTLEATAPDTTASWLCSAFPGLCSSATPVIANK